MTSTPRRISARIMLLTALLASALGGCAEPVSQIEQGHALVTGKPPYDDFFEAVRTVREDARRAEGQVADARGELRRNLGLDATADANATIVAARERAAKLRSAGVALHLELAPDLKLTTGGRPRSLDAADRSFVGALEASVKSSLDVSRQLGEISRRAAELKSKREELQGQLKAVFADQREGRRSEIAHELAAADRVLAESAELGDRHAGLASKFVLDLAQAIEVDAGANAATTPNRTAKGQPSRTPGGSRGARSTVTTQPTTAKPGARSAAATAPRSAPQPKPAAQSAAAPKAHSGDDFDP